MLMFIGFGICLSAYYIYQNKESVFMNIAKASLRIEDIYLNYVGLSVSYLVPDHSNSSLLDQYNKYYLDRYVSNLSHQDKYNKANNEYFVILKYNIKRKILCYVKNSFTFSEIELCDKDINFSSPIILCNISIYETDPETNERKTLFDEIDVTECFNYLINRNSRIILSNNNKYKEFWIYYLNYFLENRNIFINFDNLDNIELSWKIMDASITTTEGSELLLITNNNSTNISIIDDIQKIDINENEYDSIDDICQLNFSKKKKNINYKYSNNLNIIEKNNNSVKNEYQEDDVDSLEVEISDGSEDNREIVEEDEDEVIVEEDEVIVEEDEVIVEEDEDEDEVIVEEDEVIVEEDEDEDEVIVEEDEDEDEVIVEEDEVIVEEDEVIVEEDEVIVEEDEDEVFLKEDEVIVEEDKDEDEVIVEEDKDEDEVIVEDIFESEVDNINEEIEIKLNIATTIVQNIVKGVVKKKGIIQMNDLN
jgi:hypothetical protein